jgi:cell division protein FtsB
MVTGGERRGRRRLVVLVAAVIATGALLFGVFPTQAFLAQRASTSRAEERLRVLSEQNDALEERVARLGTDAEIERLARERYNLVRPGEEAYAVLPPPDPVKVPDGWPFDRLDPLLEP